MLDRHRSGKEWLVEGITMSGGQTLDLQHSNHLHNHWSLSVNQLCRRSSRRWGFCFFLLLCVPRPSPSMPFFHLQPCYVCLFHETLMISSSGFPNLFNIPSLFLLYYSFIQNHHFRAQWGILQVYWYHTHRKITILLESSLGCYVFWPVPVFCGIGIKREKVAHFKNRIPTTDDFIFAPCCEQRRDTGVIQNDGSQWTLRVLLHPV